VVVTKRSSKRSRKLTKFLVTKLSVISTTSSERKLSLKEVEVVVAPHLLILCSLDKAGSSNSVDLKRVSQSNTPLK